MGVGSMGAHETKQWTWLHRKSFTHEQQALNCVKQEIMCAKKNLPLFTQLLFSWNALRPENGYFTFYVQVRNQTTQKWSKWHKMMSWGATIQQSFTSESDQFSSYHHVRLETNKTLADAFAIKVKSEQDADLSLLKSFTVNLANLNEFSHEDEKKLHTLPSLYVKDVPSISQFTLKHPRNDGLCSPTSCTMLASYLLCSKIDPLIFAEKSFDTGLDKYGSWPFNMAHAYECGQQKVGFAVARLSSFKNLYEQLKKSIPVAVSVRGYIKGAPRLYHNGHLLVVVGYDGKTKEVICHDPAASDTSLVKKRYSLKNFLNAWERSHRLAYLAQRIS